MTVNIVDRFLREMLPDFPQGYTSQQIEYLTRDTSSEEIWNFRPDLAKRFM